MPAGHWSLMSVTDGADSQLLTQLLNKTAPGFKAVGIEGKLQALEDFRGRMLLLVFLRHFA
jgi:hypothetical protein